LGRAQAIWSWCEEMNVLSRIDRGVVEAMERLA
jgi:hypothetical protein